MKKSVELVTTHATVYAYAHLQILFAVLALLALQNMERLMNYVSYQCSHQNMDQQSSSLRCSVASSNLGNNYLDRSFAGMISCLYSKVQA